MDRAFDVLSYEEQVKDLKKAKKAIEAVAGRIEAFRAPAGRINKETVKALEKLRKVFIDKITRNILW